MERSQSDIMAGLVAVEVQIDAWDTDGGTALHRATLREDATMMDFLLDPGHLWNAIIFLRNERIIKFCSIMGRP